MVSCPDLRRSWVPRRLLMRALYLSVKTRLAHSPCFAAIALLEVMTTGWTIKIRAGHFGPTPGTLLTDDSVTRDTKSGHTAPHAERNEQEGGDGDCHARLEFAWTLLLRHRSHSSHASNRLQNAISGIYPNPTACFTDEGLDGDVAKEPLVPVVARSATHFRRWQRRCHESMSKTESCCLAWRSEWRAETGHDQRAIAVE